MNRWVLTSMAVVLALAITACSSNPSSTSLPPDNQAESPTETAPTDITTTDATAIDTASVETAERIVAMTSLTADLVQTLNEDALIGIPGSSLITDDPRFEELPVVSQGRAEPDLEQIVSLEPDLVIGAAGFHDRTLQRLNELNIRTLQTEVNSWADLRSLTELLAGIVSAEPQPLLDRYDACLAQAPDTSQEVLILVSRQPLLTPNKDSWAGDFLTQLNITNAASDLQGQSPFDGYVTLSEEKVLDTNPSALIVIDTGENLMEQLNAEPFWRNLKATQDEKVYGFEYFGLINPGSIASIEQACNQISKQLKS